MDPSTYCRELEAYLCRKNGGHLVRIVGPSFELVSGWAATGVPFKVACRGVDRCCERHEAKGPRRRPVRIEFCEADVLDEFDDWRRAVGVSAAAGSAGEGAEAGSPGGPRVSLPRHLDRVAARLTALVSGRPLSPPFAERIAAALDEIEALRSGARGLRGAARDEAVARLAALDRAVLGAARAELAGERDALVRDAASELQPFRARMTHEAWSAAIEAAVDRLIRERLGLPVIELD